MAAKCMMVAGGAASLLATIPGISWKVHAAETTPEPAKIKVAELPIYDKPVNQTEYVFVEEEIGSFRSVVSDVRKSVWSYLDSIQETTDSLKQKYETGKAHTSELITYIQEDPAILPRAGVITVAGLGGIVAGYKGGILRKVVLSTSAMGAAAALCYPKEAVALSKDVYNMTYDTIRPIWESDNKSEAVVKQAEKIVEKTEEAVKDVKQEIKDKVKQIEKGSNSGKPVDKSLLDMGQSKAEDKDMYTTRGS